MKLKIINSIPLSLTKLAWIIICCLNISSSKKKKKKKKKNFFFLMRIYLGSKLLFNQVCNRRKACKELSDKTESIAIIFSAEINLLWQLNRVWVSIKLYYIYIYTHTHTHTHTRGVLIFGQLYIHIFGSII